MQTCSLRLIFNKNAYQIILTIVQKPAKMNHYKLFLSISILIFSSLSLFSQPGRGPGPGPGQGRLYNERMQAIESRRVAHITSALSLTPAEAREFWPVYNEYLDKVNRMNQEARIWQEKISDIEKLSNKEAAELAELEVQRMEDAAALRRSCHEKLKEVLPMKKIALLYEAERSFNRMLFRQTQHRMGE